jgi:glucokinase
MKSRLNTNPGTVPANYKGSGTNARRLRAANQRAGFHGAMKKTGLVVGVDIGGTNLRLALADLQGNVLGRWSASTIATSSPDQVILQIEQGIDFLLRQCSSSRRALLSVAAGVPGVTNPQLGVVLATSYLRGWKDVPFQHLLESALGVPASVENDVRTAAIGEHWKGEARGVQDFVFLAIGTGIAAGIFVNGKLVHGVNFAAGEIGYMYVPGGTEEPAGPASPGSLESAIGGDGVRQQWAKSCPADTVPQNLSATEIFTRASAGDCLAKNVLDRTARLLAYAVYNIGLVLNSSLFVLGGGLGVSGPLRAATERILQQYSEPSEPKLVISSLGADAQIMGAIRLAITTAKAHRKRSA